MSIAAISTNYALAPKISTVANNTWKKPAEGFLMINVDGSFEEIKGVGSTGAVIRDSSGGFIAASYSYISHVCGRSYGGSFSFERRTITGLTDWF
jgi:hypothetical protein